MAPRPKPLPVEKFAEEARKDPSKVLSVPVRRFVGVGEVAEGSALIPIIMSTSAEDRARDTVSDDGWDLKNYLSNPVLLWSHDLSLPAIGRVVNLATAPLRGGMEFVSRDVYDFGGMIGDLYRKGFLRAGSVGFMPEEYSLLDNGGVNFKRQSLNEFSCCNVGMNPEALVSAKSMGVQVDLFVPFAEKKLDKAEDAPFWFTPEEAWAVHRALTPRLHAVPDVEKAVASIRAEMTGAVERLSKQVEGLAALVKPTAPAAPSFDPKAVATAAAQAVHRQLAPAFGSPE